MQRGEARSRLVVLAIDAGDTKLRVLDHIPQRARGLEANPKFISVSVLLQEDIFVAIRTV